MNAIELNHLTKTYPGFALSDLTLTLPSGCIMGLVGENGAGKSTAIHLMLNILRPDSGSIRLLGCPEDQLPKEDIGVVLDEVGLPQCLNARQVGSMMRSVYKNWDETTYQNLLTRLAVPTGKKFQEMSRGMKMKLGIAVALSHKAKLLILDEATNGLDPVARDEVLELLNDFTRDPGHSVLISSHIVSDLEKICDYIAFLHHGRLLLCEEKDALRERYGLLRCSREELAALNPAAIKGRRDTGYGVKALVERPLLPPETAVSPVDIEDLFIFMVKEVG